MSNFDFLVVVIDLLFPIVSFWTFGTIINVYHRLSPGVEGGYGVDRVDGINVVPFMQLPCRLRRGMQLKSDDISSTMVYVWHAWSSGINEVVVSVSHVGANTVYMWLYMLEYPLSLQGLFWRDNLGAPHILTVVGRVLVSFLCD